MSASVSSVPQGSTAQQTPSTSSDANQFDNLDLNQFIQLLVTELQNQDPTEPMNNSEILNQISQIKSIASNQKLSDTLSSMQLQQNLDSGGILLGRTISGLDSNTDKVSGNVDSVSIENGEVVLHVGDKTVSLKNVSSIDPTTAKDKVAETLSAMQLQQNITMGGEMIGQTIEGADANNNKVTGIVDSMSIKNNEVTLHVGDNDILLKNVTSVKKSAT
jgi:flagellar basal-body rod modification protein FlgD